jgi:TPR repeat protein
MVLRIKNPIKKPLFLLTVVSAFVLLAAVGYCVDGHADPAVLNAKVLNILKEEHKPVTPHVQRIAARFIQQDRKLFISYCWDEKYSTVPMVNDFEKFIQGRGVKEYYRDKRKEEGYGMTPGTNIEDFMKKARHSDAVVIFLNDAYLRSRNCMYEFLQVWDAEKKKISPNALIIRHPDFSGLFGKGDTAKPYREHWKGFYGELYHDANKDIPAHDRPKILKDMIFASEVEASISSIINEIAGHIQVDYSELRKNGFEDVFKRALAKGDEYYNLGNTYYYGKGVGQDYVQAREWYARAAAQGNVDAQINLAILYRDGKGVEQDYVQAREWYARLAAQGNVNAQINLAVLYRDGKGVEQDYVQAREWYARLAAQGNVDAQINLAILYRDGKGVGQDYVQAREWYEKAASKGNVNAQINLAVLYRDGKEGVPQDYGQAGEWYEKAAAQGNAEAQNSLGNLYRDGKGVPQDYAQAREWYEKAAAQGYAEAQRNLGVLYYKGLGIPKAYDHAEEWFEKAANKGDAGAQNWYGYLHHYKQGNPQANQGSPQDYKKAKEWYEKAAAQGNQYGQKNLGILYENGNGVPQDYEKAREWYEKAAAQGNPDAKKALDSIKHLGREK